jgi:hypothetical protein
MRMSKKLVAAALLSALILPLAACPKRPAAEVETVTDPAPTSEAPVTSTETPLSGEEISPDPGGEIDLEIDAGASHGGAAHVHGLASLAATLDGTELIVAIDSPLDNFGLPETTEASAVNAKALFDGAISIDNGASCTRSTVDAEVLRTGDHGSVILTGIYACTAPGDVSGVTFKGFKTYSEFEQVSAIYIAPESSNAADLTPDAPTLIFD